MLLLQEAARTSGGEEGSLLRCPGLLGFAFHWSPLRPALHSFIYSFIQYLLGHHCAMGWTTVVHKSDQVFALMELIAWWQGENTNKNLLPIVISAPEKRHQIKAR